MKKLFALIAVALVGLSASFAIDVGTLSGTWTDANWNANWSIGADTNGKGQIVLSNAKTGKTIWVFNDSNIRDFEPIIGTNGAGFSFYCKSTMRKYTFMKPISVSSDLNLSIDRDWTDEPYEVSMSWASGDAAVDGKSLVDTTKNAVETTKEVASDVSSALDALTER